MNLFLIVIKLLLMHKSCINYIKCKKMIAQYENYHFFQSMLTHLRDRAEVRNVTGTFQLYEKKI